MAADGGASRSGPAAAALAVAATVAALASLSASVRPAAPVLAAALGAAAAVVALRGGAAEDRARPAGSSEPSDAAGARALAVAHEQIETLESLLDAAGEGILHVDRHGTILRANAAARTILALGPRSTSSATSPAASSLGIAELAAAAISSNEPVVHERALHLPERRLIAVRALPARDGAVLLLSDVTTARRSEQVRRDFVANVSHELKTPVSGIALLAEQLAHAMREDPAAAGRFAERIATESERLARLVVDLLDLSRIESDSPLQTVRVEAAALAREVAERVAPLADAKRIAIHVEPGPADAAFEADPASAATALGNLLDNAVRYSPDGAEVRVRVERAPGEVSFVVADNGPGIPSEELDRIFERFYRVDKARARATGGTGLGLSIVRHAAERHGGRVSARSELGRGSTFTLTFPVGRDEA